jgi:hypothetical protein
VDIIVYLERRFREIVVDKLDPKSRQDILSQRDPYTMTDMERVKLRKSILLLVYGMLKRPN